MKNTTEKENTANYRCRLNKSTIIFLSNKNYGIMKYSQLISQQLLNSSDSGLRSILCLIVLEPLDRSQARWADSCGYAFPGNISESLFFPLFSYSLPLVA